jgi:hypothetical protein
MLLAVCSTLINHYKLSGARYDAYVHANSAFSTHTIDGIDTIDGN